MRESTVNAERILLLAAGGILLLLFIWFQLTLLLLGFAGLLLSILLHAVANWISQHARLRPFAAYLTTLVMLVAVIVGMALLLTPRVLTQLSQAATVVPKSVNEAKTYLMRQPWGSQALKLLRNAGPGTGIQVASMAKDVVSGAADLVIVLVIGFFGALNPKGYREGVLLLVPHNQRASARKLIGKVVATLRSWLLGQLIPMVVLGIASMITLWLLGVPLAFTIGLLTGIMIFVPYIGSIFSGMLAILMGLQRSPHTALLVFVLYCVFHVVEGYLLTPFVQKKIVRLPPIVTVLSEFFLWTVAGVLGVAVAAPLAAVALVIVKNLYLEPGLNADG